MIEYLKDKITILKGVIYVDPSSCQFYPVAFAIGLTTKHGELDCIVALDLIDPEKPPELGNIGGLIKLDDQKYLIFDDEEHDRHIKNLMLSANLRHCPSKLELVKELIDKGDAGIINIAELEDQYMEKTGHVNHNSDIQSPVYQRKSDLTNGEEEFILPVMPDCDFYLSLNRKALDEFLKDSENINSEES